MSSQVLVAIIMGSRADWPVMQHAAETLEKLEIAHEALVMSAHRTPDRAARFAAAARERGLKVIIAGAGGARAVPELVAGQHPAGCV